MKKKVYIFPIKTNKRILNPYVIHLRDTLSTRYTIANAKGANYGVFDLFYYWKCDYFIFNWTENLPNLKFGFFQTIAYVFCTLIIKLFKRKKIIYIFHNKTPHFERSYLSSFILYYNSRFADIVITHAKVGIEYYQKKYSKNNITYIPHPKYENVYPINSRSIKYDIILWGNIEPYKNITSFLKYVATNDYLKSKRILICGKCNSQNYLEEINKELTPNITFKNQYLDDNELAELISESKLILFCYSSDSVLSSGALVYSLSFLKPIIGPNVGAFRDYKELGLIKTYEDFHEINANLCCFQPDIKLISEYLYENTWANFGKQVEKLIEKQSH